MEGAGCSHNINVRIVLINLDLNAVADIYHHITACAMEPSPDSTRNGKPVSIISRLSM